MSMYWRCTNCKAIQAKEPLVEGVATRPIGDATISQVRCIKCLATFPLADVLSGLHDAEPPEMSESEAGHPVVAENTPDVSSSPPSPPPPTQSWPQSDPDALEAMADEFLAPQGSEEQELGEPVVEASMPTQAPNESTLDTLDEVEDESDFEESADYEEGSDFFDLNDQGENHHELKYEFAPKTTEPDPNVDSMAPRSQIANGAELDEELLAALSAEDPAPRASIPASLSAPSSDLIDLEATDTVGVYHDISLTVESVHVVDDGFLEFRPVLPAEVICCDVCALHIREASGYLLSADEIADSTEYLELILERWQVNGYLPRGPVVPAWRESARRDVAAQGGQAPWLVCDDCILLFPAIRGDALQKAANRARAWWPSDHIRREDEAHANEREFPFPVPMDAAATQAGSNTFAVVDGTDSQPLVTAGKEMVPDDRLVNAEHCDGGTESDTARNSPTIHLASPETGTNHEDSATDPPITSEGDVDRKAAERLDDL